MLHLRQTLASLRDSQGLAHIGLRTKLQLVQDWPRTKVDATEPDLVEEGETAIFWGRTCLGFVFYRIMRNAWLWGWPARTALFQDEQVRE